MSTKKSLDSIEFKSTEWRKRVPPELRIKVDENDVERSSKENCHVATTAATTKRYLEYLSSVWKRVPKLTKTRVGTIGNGTYSNIIKVQDDENSQKQACKIFEIGKIDVEKEKVVNRLGREVRALVRLGAHRNIVQFVELQRTPERAYLILEHLEGANGTQDLLEFVMRFAPLREKLARSIFEQLLCAVRYCHENEIAHRDIKPENIVVMKDDTPPHKLRVVLIDFGLSECNGNIEAKPCGTPLYSSPEEFKDGEKIAMMPADMWSLGVVLYVLVCGKLPFEAPTLSKLREKILHDKLDIPRSISESCAELLRGLLCKDSSQRYDIRRASSHSWIESRRRSNAPVSSPNTTTTSVYPNAYWFSAPIASYDKTKSPVLSARQQQKVPMSKKEEMSLPPPLDLDSTLLLPKKSESHGLHDWMYEIEEEEETEEEEKEEEEEEGVYWGRGPRRLSPRISPQATKNERDLIPPNKTRGIIMNGDGDDRNSEVSTSFGEDDEEEEIEGDGPGWYFGGE